MALNETHMQIAEASATQTDAAIVEALAELVDDTFSVMGELKHVTCTMYGDLEVYSYKGKDFIRMYPLEISTTAGVDGYHVVATRKYEVLV